MRCEKHNWDQTWDDCPLCTEEEREKFAQPALLCADCGIQAKPPYDNGDGKVRCEACAVYKYERGDLLGKDEKTQQ